MKGRDLWKGALFGSLSLGSSTLWGVVSGWVLYFYLPPDGKGAALIPIGLYSVVVLVSRAVDVLAGMPIGHFSDRLKTPWGRRIPLILAGSLVMPAAFVLIWMPPDAHESLRNLFYLTAVLLVFNLAYSLREIPYQALLPEVAPSDAQRVGFSAWKSGFQLLGVVFSGVAGWLIETGGYRWAGIVYAAGMAPFFLLPLFGVREQPCQPVAHASPQAESGAKAERLDFWKGSARTLRNPAFQVFIIAWALYWMASTLVMETIPYVATEICQMSEAGTMYLYLPAVFVSLAAFPLVGWLSARIGKRRAFAGSLLVSALVLPGVALISPRLPISLTAQGVIWVVLEALTLAGAQVLPSAIAAEITDQDALQTGERREGSYFAAWGLADQIASGLASALLPLLLLLGRSQDAPRGPLGIRAAGILGGLLLLGAFFIFRRYPYRTENKI